MPEGKAYFAFHFVLYDFKVTKYPAVLSNEPKGHYTCLFTVDKKIPAGDNAPTTHYQPAAGM